MKGHTNILALRQTVDKLFCRIDSPGRRSRAGATRHDTERPTKQPALWRPSHQNEHRRCTGSTARHTD